MVDIGSLVSYLRLNNDQFNKNMRQSATLLQSQSVKMNRSMATLERSFRKQVGGLTKQLASFKGALAAIGVGFSAKQIASSFLDVAGSFEQMELKLNAITKGRGVETLDRINKWALDMPVNTRKAVDTFSMMAAMGLNPTIEKMQTLVDVSVIFGEDAMPRVARALGQMQTLGKLSAEELNQLADAGIDARKYLTEAFGMSAEQIQKSGMDINRVIEAIMNGLDRDFGGAAKSAMSNWQGLKATTVSYIEEIQRKIMAAGVFDELKKQLSGINQQLKNWIDNNDSLIKQKVPEWIEKTKDGLNKIWSVISYDPAIIEYGIIGLAIGGKKGAAVLGGLAHMKTWAENLGKALGMVSTGILDMSEVAKANFKELEELVKKGEQRMAGGAFYRGRIPQEPGNVSVGGVNAPPPPPGNSEPLEKFLQKVERLHKEAQATIGGGWVNQWDRMQAAIKDQQKAHEDFLTEVERQSEQAQATIDRGWKNQAEQMEKALADPDKFFGPLKKSAAQTFGEDLKNAVTGWASTWSQTLNDMLWSAETTFGDILRSFGKMITQMTIQKGIVEPVITGIGDILDSLFNNAHGNAFAGGQRLAYAHGGIVNRPTVFPMRRGMGLMGEAGPEAILPLTRTSGGDLGVKSTGGGGGNVYIQVQNNTNAQAQVRESRTARGDRSIHILIDEAVAANIRSPGKATHWAIRNTFGARPMVEGR